VVTTVDTGPWPLCCSPPVGQVVGDRAAAGLPASTGTVLHKHRGCGSYE